MTVEDHLGRERRMAADFNRDVAPLGIEDVEGVVVHIGHRLLGFDVMVGADVPYRRLGTAYQNQKQALRDLGLCQVSFRQLMLALPGSTASARSKRKEIASLGKIRITWVRRFNSWLSRSTAGCRQTNRRACFKSGS